MRADHNAQLAVGLRLCVSPQLPRSCLLGLLLVLDQDGVNGHPLLVGETDKHGRLLLGRHGVVAQSGKEEAGMGRNGENTDERVVTTRCGA